MKTRQVGKLKKTASSHNVDYGSVSASEARLDIVKYSSLKFARVWGVWSEKLSSVVFASPCWSDCAYTIACAPVGVEKSLSIVRFDVASCYLGAARAVPKLKIPTGGKINGAKRQSA